jgi:hypothetical protein
MRKIIVQALPTAREMEELLQSLVDNKESKFSRVLDLDVSHIDMRAQVYGVRITDVDLSPDSIGVSYEVDYNVYNGCKDMDIDDFQDGFVTGVRTSAGWEFEEFIPPPKRNTVDEF